MARNGEIVLYRQQHPQWQKHCHPAGQEDLQHYRKQQGSAGPRCQHAYDMNQGQRLPLWPGGRGHTVDARTRLQSGQGGQIWLGEEDNYISDNSILSAMLKLASKMSKALARELKEACAEATTLKEELQRRGFVAEAEPQEENTGEDG